jgi:hypothetical protein
MSDFDLEFGVRVSNVDAAVRDVGRVADANRTAAQTTERAAQTSARAMSQLGTSVQQVGQRAGQTVGAIGQMAGQLGQVAGLSTSAGSAISQLGGAVSALSGAMGPLGVALGAATLAITAINTALNYEANRHRDAEQAARDHTEQLRSLATAARQARTELSLQRDIAGSIGSVGGDQLQQQAEERRQRVLELERTRAERLAGFGLVERNGQVFRRNAFGEIAASLPAGFESGDGSQAEIARLREEVTSIERELVRREEQASADQRTAQAESTAAAVRSENELADRNRPRARRSGASSADEEARIEAEGLRRLEAMRRADELRRIESFRFIEEAAKEHEAELQRLAQETADEQKRLDEEKRQQAREQQEELKATAEESSRDFRESWRGSLMDVIDAWREANTAMRNAGGQMLSTSELLRVGMTSVGNEIAETIGGTMVGAFENALGAWLDGSKSFVEAAEDMVKGVLKALVIESIVQAVTETARGIADLASAISSNNAQLYASSTAHFAAAAAWGAVAGVAGGVGAATGAFGGGGGVGAGAYAGGTVTPTDASTTAAPSQPVTINVYPGGFITRRDMYAGVVDALNESAREGYRVDPSLIGS